MANSKSYEVVLLNFSKAGFHFSSGKADNYDRSRQRIHSDTLKAALFTSIIRLYGDTFLEDNGQDSFFNAFRISSAFPFWMDKQGQHYFFLPKPALPLKELFKDSHLENNPELAKKFKKIKYIEAGLLQKILRKNQQVSLDDVSTDEKFLIQDCTMKEPLFQTAIKQQVQIARDGNDDSLPYGVDKVYFSEKSGLYVLHDGLSNEFGAQLKAAWRLLGEDGIGTDRSTGNGSFTPVFSKKAFTWPTHDDSEWQTNLSLYWPQKGEVSKMEKARYQLTRRGGYIAQPRDNNHLSIRKRSVYMMTEGSTFPVNELLEGRLGDLKPVPEPLMRAGIKPIGHPVWRDGRSIFLPL